MKTTNKKVKMFGGDMTKVMSAINEFCSHDNVEFLDVRICERESMCSDQLMAVVIYQNV